MSMYLDVARYGHLFVNLFRRDLGVKYRGSLFGVAWTLVNPLVLMLGYWLLFSILLRAVSIPHYPLFVLSGLVSWLFFQSSVQMAAGSLLAQSSLVKQVRFPRQLVPFAVVATNLVTLGIMLAILIPVCLIVVPDTRETFWAAFPMLLTLVALASGFAVVLAASTVIYRDIEHLLTAIILPWFIITPIFYTFDQLPGLQAHQGLANILYYGNPVAPIVQAVRDPLFFGHLPTRTDVIYACCVGIAALVVGAILFRRLDDRMAAEL